MTAAAWRDTEAIRLLRCNGSPGCSDSSVQLFSNFRSGVSYLSLHNAHRVLNVAVRHAAAATLPPTDIWSCVYDGFKYTVCFCLFLNLFLVPFLLLVLNATCRLNAHMLAYVSNEE